VGDVLLKVLDQILKLRNPADTADVDLTAKAGTCSGDLLTSGLLKAGTTPVTLTNAAGYIVLDGLAYGMLCLVDHILIDDAGITKTDPGTTYVDLFAHYSYTIYYFDKFRAKYARIVVRAAGTETGPGKGVCLWNDTDKTVLCEAVWDGAGIRDVHGPWTDVSGLTAAKSIRVQVKGSSATEDMTVWKIVVEFY